MTTRSITVPAEAASLPMLRGFLSEVCGAAGVGEEALGDILLAVDEAATNVAWYAYPEGTPGVIQVACDVDGEAVRIEITDQGRPHEPEDPGPPDLEAMLDGRREPGGFGIHLIHKVMDEVSFDTGPDGNHLRFVKYRSQGRG